jgi:hypothetical protein
MIQGWILNNTGLHDRLGSYLTMMGFMIHRWILNNTVLHDTLVGYLTILGFKIHWAAI